MRKLILLLCMTMLCIVGQAQDNDFYSRALAAKQAGGEQLETFRKEITGLAKSKKEKDVLNAYAGYYGLGERQKADSLDKAILKRFPHGERAATKQAVSLFNANDGAAAEKAYKAFAKKFPNKKGALNATYDQAAFAVAYKLAAEGDADKAVAYTHKVTTPVMKCYVSSIVGETLAAKGKTEAAGQLLREGCEAADSVVPTLKGQNKAQASMVYSTYAEWLAANGKADEAWTLYNDKVTRKESSETYWKLAVSHGQAMQAWTHMDGVLRKGYLSKDGEALMRDIWQKVNGNADGFDAYIKQANEDRVAEKLAKLPGQMVKKPAPDFTLKDIDGNTVQLSQLRGKVVVLDFWATWCGPCKRSLPAMRKTLAKYKDDPDVVFLFIHTWERGTAEEASKEAKAYLDDNGFSEFHLVMDTRDPETKTNKAVSAFGVHGIPAKFVIDKEGNIRFEISGFGGSDDDAVAELSGMIELAKKAK